MSLMNTPHLTADQKAQGLPDLVRVLIVEDQRFDRMKLMRMCGRIDIPTAVTEVATLAAMLDKLEQSRFDLVLLDHHLPDGTGLQGVEMIRSTMVNRHVATIMVTGTEDADVAVQALKMGFSDYLTKDEISHATLRRAMINALQKSQLTTGIEISGAAARQTNALLHRFSRECAQEIKPVVSRMLRQLREVKHLPMEEAAARLERIEGSCGRLWTFLNELERFGEVVAAEGTVEEPARIRASSKPPSPFSRRRAS